MASTALVKVREQLHALKARHGKAAAHAKRGFKVLGDSAVIGGAALVAGYAQGRYGAVKIPHTNVPVDLTLAGGFYVAGLMEPLGETAAHQSFNIAYGLVASHLTAVGRGAGKKARAKAGKAPLMEGQQDAELSNLLDGLSGQGRDGGGALSDDDLVSLAQGV